MCWFPSGPPVSYLPCPVPDPSRAWGSIDCSRCKGVCYGHFLDPKAAYRSNIPPMIKPPSQVMKEEFDHRKGCKPDDSFIKEVAARVLLPPEVEMWMEHLAAVQKNRKRGVEKAAETCQQSQTETQQTSSFCHVCGLPYELYTDEVENWIACDECEEWFHFECVGIVTVPEVFFCSQCQSES